MPRGSAGSGSRSPSSTLASRGWPLPKPGGTCPTRWSPATSPAPASKPAITTAPRWRRSSTTSPRGPACISSRSETKWTWITPSATASPKGWTSSTIPWAGTTPTSTMGPAWLGISCAGPRRPASCGSRRRGTTPGSTGRAISPTPTPTVGWTPSSPSPPPPGTTPSCTSPGTAGPRPPTTMTFTFTARMGPWWPPPPRPKGAARSPPSGCR